MAITGGVKFFTNNLALAKDGSTISASTGNASAANMLSRNKLAIWKSQGSDDSTTETITITLPQAETFSRLFVIGHNWKQFQIQYDNAGLTDFASVVGLDGALVGGISETAFVDPVLYYEFTPVSTDEITITVDKTQTVDAEKYANLFVICTELGTLAGFPKVSPMINRNQRVTKMLDGRTRVDSGPETFSCEIRFENYPVRTEYAADNTLIADTLFFRDEAFHVWPCGGRRGSDYFGHTIPGFRLQDLELVRISNRQEAEYPDGIYVNPITVSMDLEEAP